MSTTNLIRSRRALDRCLQTVSVLCACPLLTGCVACSLASDTGPSQTGVWSVASKQAAHVGEEVHFSLVLRKPMRDEVLSHQGIADYAALFVNDERFEDDANLEGRFEFKYIPEASLNGKTLEVQAEAYRMHGKRDYMKILGTWRRSQSTMDQDDEKIAESSIELEVYQSKVYYQFGKPSADLDWATARLVLTRRDGNVSTVFAATSHRRGFFVHSNESQDAVVVEYEPLASEVNKTGTTVVVLHVFDLDGLEHAYKFQIDTP